MDPIANISESKSVDFLKKCIFCQSRRCDDEKLVHPKEKGFQSVQSSASLRKSKDDRKYEGAINRIQLVTNLEDMLYHRKCFLDFTNVTNISRLKSKTTTTASSSDTAQSSSSEIGIKNTKSTSKTDLAMIVLCNELKSAAEKGEVHLLVDVWIRYTELATQFDQTIPPSYESRRSTFKEKLKGALGDTFQFYQPLNRDIHERQMMLIPTKFQHNLTSRVTETVYLNQSDQNESYDANKFINIIKAAYEIRKDLQEKGNQSSFNISEEMAKSMIPQSLYIFLSIVMGLKDYHNDLDDEINTDDGNGSDTEDDSEDDSENANEDDTIDNEEDGLDTEHGKENNFNKGLFKKVLSVAQDIIYITSNGRKITPKHLGLALSLHQTKRSRKLLSLFNKAGHCMSYKQVLQTDNTLAEITLSTLENDSGAVIPPNIMPCESPDSTNSILQITADNIDMLTKTLDGKNTFHATQMVVFQRGGKSTDDILQTIRPKKYASALRVPAVLNALPAPIHDMQVNPVFKNAVDVEWYEEAFKNCKINEKDLSFVFLRDKQPEGKRKGWTKFNKEISTNNDSLTASGFMPLILNPAHEYNTLTVVLNRCISVANNLNYKYVILTVDQALYCRLINIRWTSEVFKERIILKMGGLHLSNNFIKSIGQHMINTGLAEIWLESGILGEGAIAKVLDGRDYAKAMRAHKLTYQALWRILIPKFMEYLRTKDTRKADSLQDMCNCGSQEIFKFFEVEENQKLIDHFLRTISENNVNAEFWIQYIKYVSVLLDFTRSMRDGLWDLYVSSLRRMLPLITRYDHLNYLKSMTVYIADLNNLPNEVLESFKSGDFVVKRTKNKFNQVDADHAQEWLVGTAKESGGITGIQNEESTLQRWALTFHWRTVITQKTFSMFGVSSTASQHNEELPARIKRDNGDEDELLKLFLDMKVFSEDNRSKPLQNLVTKDVATIPIQNALLNAFDEGLIQVSDFVKSRLIPQEDGNVKVDYNAPLTRINAMTMGSLENQKKTIITESKIMKSNAKRLQQIILSYEAGRPIDLSFVLKHELNTFPLGLAELDGSLRSGDKNSFMNLFLKNVHCPTALQAAKESCHYIYNADVVIATLKKPKSINNFGEYAEKFVSYIKDHSQLTSRVDILFDRFLDSSAKNIRRLKSSKIVSIRRTIESGNVPLPKSWVNFLSSNENKADLAKFLSNELSCNQFGNMNVVTAGGFEDVLSTSIKSSNNSFDGKSLISNHKEADIRAVLHAVESKASRIVINAHEPDIFPMLIHFFDRMNCNELWLATGTTNKYVPIHAIHSTIPDELKGRILAFHTVTGSNYTSYLRVTKAGAWKIFQQFSHLLKGLGDELLTEIVINAVEEFLVKCFVPDLNVQTFDDARVWLFKKLKNVTDLPPTSDSIRLHILRCHWATYTWQNACNQNVSFKDPTDYGWELGDKNELVPTLMSSNVHTNEPSEFITCGCGTKCITMRCSCRKNQLNCTALCKCFGECSNVNVVN